MSQRVLGTVLLKAAVNQRQLAVVIGVQVELGKGLVATCSTMVAVAVGVHARGIEYKADIIGGAFGSEVVFAHAVAADQGFGTNARRAFAITGEHLNNPAGVAAVQGGRRATQHFNALGGIEVEGGGLPLTVGSAGRDTVCNQLDATHAECRARAKATGGNLQVLGVVLTVLHHQPRHPG